jgi:hypothetical protein
MSSAAIGLVALASLPFVLLAACGGEPARAEHAAATTETAPPATSTASSPESNVDPRLACKVSTDCFIVSSCDCTKCIAASAHPGVCPTVCSSNPCDKRGVACVAGACAVSER